MKKLICSLLIIAILMNFIVASNCYAEDASTSGGAADLMLNFEGDENQTAVPTVEGVTSVLEDGTAQTKNGGGRTIQTTPNMAGPSIIGVIMGYICLIIDIVPLQLQIILSTLALTEVTTSKTDYDTFWITVEKIVFNEVPLFNINYFNTDNSYTVGNDATTQLTIKASDTNNAIKESITKMYMICRILAMIISLLVLIYIGIRMAISTIATDRAKYKKMLVSWVESIVIMFLLIYIIVAVINFGEALTNIFYDIKEDFPKIVDAAGNPHSNSFEITISDTITKYLITSSGLQLAMYSIMYWIVIYAQFKFFYLYIKRTLMVGFLIMIAPLITITYSIDKAGDGKAQAFSTWFSELLLNVLIQPLHALIYMVFMFTAGAIAIYAPIVAILFLISLGSAEKMVKLIFNMSGSVILKGIDDVLGKGK